MLATAAVTIVTVGAGVVADATVGTVPGPSGDAPWAAGPLEGLAPEVVTDGPAEVVAQLTGAGSPNDTATRWNVHGTDLGHTFEHRGELYMVFGDTYGEGGLQGADWRSNVLARIADPDPAAGLAFTEMVAGPSGQAREILHSRKINGVEKTVIPTYGVSTGDRMVLHYMSVRRWGAAGEWDVDHAGLAWSDNGRTWLKARDAVWSGDTFAQVAFVPAAGRIYVFGIPAGRSGGARLARVDRAELLDLDAWEYWTGETWVRGDRGAAVEVVPGPVGELSVTWSPAHARWLMLYLNHDGEAVVLRSARSLTGPWSAESTVVTAAEQPTLYAPYVVPGASGDELYFTLSRFDVYNVFLLKVGLHRVVDVLPDPIGS